MSVKVHVPIKVRLDAAAGDDPGTTIVPPFEQALSRALVSSRSAVLASKRGRISLAIDYPAFTWTGAGREGMTHDAQARVEQALTQAIRETARLRGVHNNGLGRRTRPPRDPWTAGKALELHGLVRPVLEWMEALGDPGLTHVYREDLDQTRDIVAVVAQANRAVSAIDLARMLADRLPRPRRGREVLWGYTTSHREVTGFADAMGDPNIVRRLDRLEPGNRFAVFGRGRNAALAPGGRILFVALEVAKTELADITTPVGWTDRTVPLRDLAFLAASELPGRLAVAWEDVVAAFGDREVSVTLEADAVRRRVHVDTLKELFYREIEQVRDDRLLFNEVLTLGDAAVSRLPASLRSAPALQGPRGSTPATLPDDGYFEPGWTLLSIRTQLPLSDGDLMVARARPVGLAAADGIARWLTGDPYELTWRFAFRDWLGGAFQGRGIDPQAAVQRCFDLVVERGQLDRLLSMVERSGGWPLLFLLLEDLTATSHAHHPRVRRSVAVLNQWTQSTRQHTYDVARQRIFIHHDDDDVLAVNGVAAAVSGALFQRSEAIDLTPSAQARLQAALPDAMIEVIRRHMNDPQNRMFGQQAILGEIINAAATRAHIVEDDILRFDLDRSVRLLRLESWMDGLVQRYRVTVEFVESKDGGPWTPVADSTRTMTDSQFEEMLLFWEIARAAVFWKYASIGVSVLALAVVAWEIGAIALLVELGGGIGMIAFSIGVAEAFYLYRVISGGKKVTLEGVLTAAFEGYLGAVGFRLFVPLGAVAGRMVAAEAITARALRVWLAERLTIGLLGGATTGASVTFAHDLIGHMTGQRRDWAGWDDYAQHISWGALLGCVGEVGGGVLHVSFRAALPGLRSVGQAVGAIRAAGISAEQWSMMTIRALRQVEAALTRDLDAALARQVIRGLRFRARQLLDAFTEAGTDIVYRRLIELSARDLSPAALEGLETYLRVGRAVLRSEQLLVKGLDGIVGMGDRAGAFLELLGRLEQGTLETLLRRGQLESLIAAPSLQGLIRTLSGEQATRLLLNVFNADLRAAERFTTGLFQRSTADQTALLEILLKPRSGVLPDTLLRAAELSGGASAAMETFLRRLHRHFEDSLVRRILEALAPERWQAFMAFLKDATDGEMARLARSETLPTIARSPRVLTYCRTDQPFLALLRIAEGGGTRAVQRLEEALVNAAQMTPNARLAFIRDFAAQVERAVEAARLPAPVIDARGLAANTVLRQHVGGPRSFTRQGLDALVRNAANDLLDRLAGLVGVEAAAVGKVLAGIGRYPNGLVREDFVAMLRMLERGVSPDLLGRLLGERGSRVVFPVSRALRMVSGFTRAEIDGLAATARFVGEGQSGIDRLIGICNNFSEPGSLFQTLGELIPHSVSGLDEVIRYAASGSMNFNQAALGALRGARDLLARNPGARLVFEVETQTGQFLRIADIIVQLPASSRLGYLRVEIKEYADLTLFDTGGAVKQLARDVHLEVQTPPPAGMHRLARLRWYVRRPAHADGRLFTDAELGPARDQVRTSLLRAFEDPTIGDALLRRQLKKVFEDNFDEIVQFF